MDEPLALATFSALSNATRLRVLKCLVSAGGAGMLAGDIAQSVGATPSRASFHLSVMSQTGLITSQRQSRQITYHINFEAMGAVLQYLLQDCCQNNAIVASCCVGDSGCG